MGGIQEENMVDITKIQNIVREAAKLFADRKAAENIIEKGLCDYVTAVDETVQSFVRKELATLYPQIQFMGEEQDNSAIDMNGFVWVLDPVDGTTNLIHDYHCSAISLALLENREPVLGIVYNPYADEMFWAEKGKGSFLNGTPISVSGAESMAESLISIGTSPYYKDRADEIFKTFTAIYKDCQDIRRCGSAAIDLAHVACGRIDAYLEQSLKIWDFAAGVLLVREAGGEVLDYSGARRTMEPVGDVVAGNGKIERILVENYLAGEMCF